VVAWAAAKFAPVWPSIAERRIIEVEYFGEQQQEGGRA